MSSDKPLSARLFLLKEMVVRDLRSRYAGSGLGVLWAFALPVLWMFLYTAVFAVILRAPVEKGYASFPEFLMAGLLPWMAISEGISRSASALTDNAAMVKKTVFPVETLVLSVILAAVVNQVIGFLVYGIYVAMVGHFSPGWALLALPALFLQVLLTFGIGCLAATVTTFLRDAVQAISIGLTVVFWATPIVYPAALVPARFRPILSANPITHLTEWYRRAFTLHMLPDAGSALYLTVCAVAAAAVGTALFFRARPHFADLI
ncbi:MAG: ABC transporter permease [Acidobacteria bacterium]|nr:ABC transporter permease [Acidobacteriota bacterium]MCA1611354.1 ABC transporter permease [Acidobacteriota bacterium]